MKTKQSDWEKVLTIMERYNRFDGYINVLGGEMTFFDSNAIIDGVHSFYVTKEDVINFTNNFKND
jgi:hypothetical protein